MSARHGRFLKVGRSDIEVWVLNLADALPDGFSPDQLLSEDERVRWRGFTHAEAGKRFMFTRAFVRQIIGASAGIAPEAVKFGVEPAGKPFIKHVSPPLFFSVSHSMEWVACAVSKGGPLGIDLEDRRRPVAMEGIVRRFFTRREAAEWQGLAHCADAQEQAFFRAWVRKEAFLKATGEGISGLATIEVSLTATGQEKRRHPWTTDPSPLRPLDSNRQNERWHCADWRLGTSFLAVAWEGDPRTVSIERWRFHREFSPCR